MDMVVLQDQGGQKGMINKMCSYHLISFRSLGMSKYKLEVSDRPNILVTSK